MITYNLLNELLKHLDGLDSEASKWFVTAVNISLESGQTLDQALGLKGLRFQHLKQQRDGYLHQAWLTLPDDLSDWKRSSMLADKIFRFESRTWPRLQHHATPPKHLDRGQRLLFEAFRLGLRMPLSARQVHNIILRNLKGVHFSQNTD